MSRLSLGSRLLIAVLIGITSGCSAKPVQTEKQHSSDPSVEDFVKRTYIHGIPYEQAIRFRSEENILKLVQILNDPALKQQWPNAVTTLGMLGGTRATQELMGFIKRGSGRLAEEEYRAKANAVLALGYTLAANHTLADSSQTEVLVFLQASVAADGSYKYQWLPPNGGEPQRDAQLKRRAIQALGVSGKSAAEIELRKLITDNSQARGTEYNALIQEALRTNDRVRANGLAEVLPKQ